MFMVVFLVYHLFSDGDFSFLMTLSSLVSTFSFLMVVFKIENIRSCAGVSLKMFECYVVLIFARLCSIIPYEGSVQSHALKQLIHVYGRQQMHLSFSPSLSLLSVSVPLFLSLSVSLGCLYRSLPPCLWLPPVSALSLRQFVVSLFPPLSYRLSLTVCLLLPVSCCLSLVACLCLRVSVTCLTTDLATGCTRRWRRFLCCCRGWWSISAAVGTQAPTRPRATPSLTSVSSSPRCCWPFSFILPSTHSCPLMSDITNHWQLHRRPNTTTPP